MMSMTFTCNMQGKQHIQKCGRKLSLALSSTAHSELVLHAHIVSNFLMFFDYDCIGWQ